MKRICASLAIVALAALAGGVSIMPACAAPPTVTPSPGYDARLQEQRARAGGYEPVVRRSETGFAAAREARFTTARIEAMPSAIAVSGCFSLALCVRLGFAVPAMAADYAGAISAYRRAHGLPAVKLDSRLNAVALKQARAMAASGSGQPQRRRQFFVARGGLAQIRGPRENIGAGFLKFCRNAEAMGKLRRPPRESPDGRARAGSASPSVDNPKSPYRKFWAMVITD